MEEILGLYRSNTTCLACLRRSPEHVLRCGHSMCSTCVEIFGEGSYDAEREYIVKRCLLCGGAELLTVRLKPPTAAMRVLSVDGGDTRGIIPLKTLLLMQERLGPELPLHELFYLAVGTV